MTLHPPFSAARDRVGRPLADASADHGPVRGPAFNANPTRRRLIQAAVGLLLAVRLGAARFVPPDSLDLAALIGPPPAADSIVTRAELETVLLLQELRTPVQAARANEIELETLFGFAADAVGPWFTADALPRTAALFTQVREDFIPVNRASKALWPRRRPPYVDARVQPCVETTDSGAYPSGHAIQSSLWALLLSELLPDHAAAFAARAAETRKMKLLSGVHYPSDLEAGRRVGEALARKMLASPRMQAALIAARAEIAARQPPLSHPGNV